MLIVDGARYKPWTPKDEEKEFHPLVKSNSTEIFGKDTIYFDVKTTLKTASGIGTIPDAYVIGLAEPYEWFVVEDELAAHPIYDHVVKQLSKFINGIENQDTRNQILELLYEEINGDKQLRTIVETKTESTDIYRFLSKLLSKRPRIVVVIDEKTLDLEDACNALKYEPDIVEFKSFVNEENPAIQAHLFEPLYASGKPVQIREAEESKAKRKLPEHYDSWEKMLRWTDEKVREVVKTLMNSMNLADLLDLTHKPIGRYYAFYRGKPASKTRFVGVILHKSNISIRIRTDPATLSDPENWLNPKVYKGYFFAHGKGQERLFKISEKVQIPYAIKLIKQSYELAK